MVDVTECVVVGAGVVGLACARAIARSGREVIVLERHGAVGTETSSRNSEVIHAGIYYPTGSLKAKLCVAGKAQLYRYCQTHQVPHAACGKIIVASSEAQLPELRGIQRQALANGVELEWLDAAAIMRVEPEVRAVAGLHSPTTGIIDSHALMLSLQGDLERADGMVALATDVQDLRGEAGGVVLSTQDMDLRCRWLVNCAGLAAPDVVRPLLPNAPRARYAVGHYYAYSGPAPFSRLVYPVPEPGGLGIHVTRDLAGQIKFGPDVVWREVIDYTFPADEAALRSKFAAAIGSYFPGLQADRLHPSYTGIRPKIVAPGEAAADFAIAGPQQHGVPGLVNLMGIESPGLTASLAIADHVVGLLRA